MIAKCPECEARYRVDDAKVGAGGARLRCAKCSTVFRIEGPAEKSLPPVPEPTQEDPPESGGQPDSERLVVVATDRQAPADELVRVLKAWGLQPLHVADGGEAMLAIQRHAPRAVILDARVRGMNGLQVCEVVKRNESLRATPIVLVADPADSRAVAALEPFGADVNRGWGDDPGDLLEILGGFGLPVKATTPSAPPVETAPAPAPARDELDGERARAARLARVVVSDLVLYQGEAFDRANRDGRLVEEFQGELAEGRQMLADRVDPRVIEERDYLAEELMRVAEDRLKD